jgi:hypothetical protein
MLNLCSLLNIRFVSAAADQHKNTNSRRTGVEPAPTSASSDSLREGFDQVAGYRKVFCAMVAKQSGALIHWLMQKMMVDLVGEDVQALLGDHVAGPVPSRAIVQFLASGLFGLMRL